MTSQTIERHPHMGIRIVARDGYTKRHAGAICQDCGGKVTDDNAEKVCYPQIARRGSLKGKVSHIMTGDYGHCRQCAAQA